VFNHENVLAQTKGAIYVFMAASELTTLQTAFKKAGGHIENWLITTMRNWCVRKPPPCLLDL
jgi:hypothetical protein